MNVLIHKDGRPRKDYSSPIQVVVWRESPRDGAGLFAEIDHRFSDGSYLSGRDGEYWMELPNQLQIDASLITHGEKIDASLLCDEDGRSERQEDDD